MRKLQAPVLPFEPSADRYAQKEDTALLTTAAQKSKSQLIPFPSQKPNTVHVAERAIQPFPIPPQQLPSTVETPRQRVREALRQLEAQAERINQLSAELEQAIWQLKKTASQVEEDSRFLGTQRRSKHGLQICQYRDAIVPIIRQKTNGQLVLTSRSIDLSKTARASHSSAHKL